MASLMLPPTLICSLLLLLCDQYAFSYPTMQRAPPFRERYLYPQPYPQLYPQVYNQPSGYMYEEGIPEYGDYYDPREGMQTLTDDQLGGYMYNDPMVIREDPYYGFPSEQRNIANWYALPEEELGYQVAPGMEFGDEEMQEEMMRDNEIVKKSEGDELVREIDALKGPVTQGSFQKEATMNLDKTTTPVPTTEPSTMASEARGQKEVPLYRPPNPSRKVIHVKPTAPSAPEESKKEDGNVYATIRRFLRSDKKRQVRTDEELAHLMEKRFAHQSPNYRSIVSTGNDLPKQLNKLKKVMA